MCKIDGLYLHDFDVILKAIYPSVRRTKAGCDIWHSFGEIEESVRRGGHFSSVAYISEKRSGSLTQGGILVMIELPLSFDTTFDEIQIYLIMEHPTHILYLTSDRAGLEFHHVPRECPGLV